jgi:integrase
MTKITKRTVDALIESGVPRLIRDDALKGFGARLNGDGSVSYLIEFRPRGVRNAPSRRLVLGRHGALTPTEARELAKQQLARVVAGEDPAAARAARRKEMTIAELLRHTVATHWSIKARPSTARNFAAMIERTLIPEFGSRTLSTLERSEIRAWHARQTHRSRQANLDLAVLRKALAIAVGDELIAHNPASGIQAFPESRRDRVPTDEELAAILEAIDTTPIRPQAALLFKLLAFTGCRRDEWRAAEWAWVDLAGRALRLPEMAAKAGARVVPLSGPAVALLAQAPRRGRFVTPDDSGEEPLSKMSVYHAWLAVCAAANVADLHLHDLRHAYATRGAGLGASALILRDALGHKTLAMTSRYVGRQVDPIRDLSDQIGAQLKALTRSRRENLVELKGRTRGS